MSGFFNGLLVFFIFAITGCGTTGSKKLDAALMSSAIIENQSTGKEVISRFGEPTKVLDIENFRLLGYRRVDSSVSPWSAVPVVGFVAGGATHKITTCIVRVSVADDIVRSLKCSYSEDFQHNLETATGQIRSEKELLDIFNESKTK